MEIINESYYQVYDRYVHDTYKTKIILFQLDVFYLFYVFNLLEILMYLSFENKNHIIIPGDTYKIPET